MSDPSIAVEQEIREFASSWNEFRTESRDLTKSVDESSEALARIEAKIQHKTTELNSLKEACAYFLEPAARRPTCRMETARQQDKRYSRPTPGKETDNTGIYCCSTGVGSSTGAGPE